MATRETRKKVDTPDDLGDALLGHIEDLIMECRANECATLTLTDLSEFYKGPVIIAIAVGNGSCQSLSDYCMQVVQEQEELDGNEEVTIH